MKISLFLLSLSENRKVSEAYHGGHLTSNLPDPEHCRQWNKKKGIAREGGKRSNKGRNKTL
jgi:hypothetical protein